LNNPKIGLTEHLSSAAKALAVKPDNPSFLVTFKAASVISSFVNLDLGGIPFPPVFIYRNYSCATSIIY